MSTGLGSLLVYTQPFINVVLLISLLPLRSAVSHAVISCLVGAYMMGKKPIVEDTVRKWGWKRHRAKRLYSFEGQNNYPPLLLISPLGPYTCIVI